MSADEMRPATSDELEADVRRLNAAAVALGSEAAEIAVRLATGVVASTVDQALDEVLAGGDLAAQTAAAGELHARLTVLRPLVGAARDRCAEAFAAYASARADEVRAAADRLRADADDRQPVTDRLLEQLAEHEGCPFQPAPLVNPVTNALGGPAKTRTELLRAEAADLDRRARDIAGARPSDRGEVGPVTSIDELLEAVAALDPLAHVVPRIDETADRAIEATLEAWARLETRKRPGTVQRLSDEDLAESLIELTASWSPAGLTVRWSLRFPPLPSNGSDEALAEHRRHTAEVRRRREERDAAWRSNPDYEDGFLRAMREEQQRKAARRAAVERLNAAGVPLSVPAINAEITAAAGR